MSSSISLKRQFLWMLSGNVFYAACQWSILIVIAKMGSVVQLGCYSLAIAVSAPIIFLTNLQLRSVQTTDASNEYPFGDYLTLRLLSNTLAFFLFILAGYILNYEKNIRSLIVLVGVMKIIEDISDIFWGLMQKVEKMQFIAMSRIIRGSLAFASFLFFFGIARETLSATVMWIIGFWTAVLLLFDLPKCQKITEIRLARDFRKLWRLARFALPLGLTRGAMALELNIPRIFLERYAGQAALGYFSAMAAFGKGLALMSQALGYAVTPRLARFYAFSANRFTHLVKKVLFLVTLLVCSVYIIFFVWDEKILITFYTGEYAQYTHIFHLVMAGCCIDILSGILINIITSTRKFVSQLVIYLINLMITLCVSFILIKTNGLIGAAWAFFLCKVVLFVGLTILLVRLIYDKYSSITPQDIEFTA